MAAPTRTVRATTSPGRTDDSKKGLAALVEKVTQLTEQQELNGVELTKKVEPMKKRMVFAWWRHCADHSSGLQTCGEWTAGCTSTALHSLSVTAHLPTLLGSLLQTTRIHLCVASLHKFAICTLQQRSCCWQMGVTFAMCGSQRHSACSWIFVLGCPMDIAVAIHGLCCLLAEHCDRTKLSTKCWDCLLYTSPSPRD